jgi:hypothetical protein
LFLFPGVSTFESTKNGVISNDGENGEGVNEFT